MSEPQFDLDFRPPAQRDLRGWVILGLLLFLAFASAITTYFAQPTKSSGSRFEQIVSEYEQATTITLRLAGDLPAMRTQRGPALERILEEARSLPAGSDRTRLIASLEYESGTSTDPPVAKSLALQARNPRDQAFSQIYSTATLRRDKAADLAKAATDGTFLGRMAAVHAYQKSGDFASRTRILGGQSLPAVLLLASLALGSLAAGMTALALKATGRLEPKGIPGEGLSDGERDNLAWRAALLFACWLGMDFLVAPIPDENVQLVLRGAAIIGLAIGLTRWKVMGVSLPARAIGLEAAGFPAKALWGVGGFLVNLPIALMLALIGATLLRALPTPTHPVQQELMRHPNPLTIATLFGLAAVAAPIWEEVMFRGFLFQALKGRWGLYGGAFASSLIFASIHPQGVPIWAALAAVGFMNCMLMHFTRSLIPSMVLHAVHNGTLLTLALLLS